MAKNARRKSKTPRHIPLPPDINNQLLQAALENDPAYRDNMTAAVNRAQAGKIRPDEFRSIQRNLAHRALYRYVRALRLPVAVLPAMEVIAHLS